MKLEKLNVHIKIVRKKLYTGVSYVSFYAILTINLETFFISIQKYILTNICGNFEQREFGFLTKSFNFLMIF